MMALSVGFASVLALFIPSMGKSLELGSLCIPFLRALTVMNTILPMAFTGRLQNILNGLQQLKLPFIIYLPAAVIIRFIPTFAGDVKQIWESLKILSLIHIFSRWLAKVSENPIVEAFPEKIDIHPGMDSSMLLSTEMPAILSELVSKPRTRRTVAYINVPYCETDVYKRQVPHGGDCFLP